ncbi:MAG: branched-chain amino acid ABC transporter permease [Bacillota bacterium]|uniref:Branched-chain amino acid transport system permease protein n=2 Tax=Carboxydocella TaxID=178898 RepID=A0A1T4RS36_9FIRM|nr:MULTISPECIES: branched-chain amino acid ABC transporter permease [Carboxydocella]AVX21877.1 branched-chain amino acid transport system permease protein [Carboxydocella thermautotrophica]AVX32280.1 branched-chain amino acid transport system permease protein [Carboxydocella thermautotrophica]SKA18646.1 branched-chain amino acid transport system permease protein [Carboxydocella sporoproducens DSM 16521]GAW27539.1 ABC transporter [Carboxydocella sp. ULO1]GAW32549.1 ABC transporter [Carboxydocel
MKMNWTKTLTTAGIMTAVWLAFTFLFNQGIIGPYWQRIVVTALINIILAVSLNLINGFTGQFSIGHAGFMAVGGYVSAVITVKLAPQWAAAGVAIPQWLLFVIALLAGSLAAALIGFIIGMPTLRLKGDYLAIATLGMGEIIRVMILNIPYVGGASGFMGIPPYSTFNWVFWICVGSYVVIKNFLWSTHGRACISIRENEIAAESMGINITKYKVMAFTMGAFFAGLAGGLFAHYFYIVHPNSFGFLKSFEILVYVVLGGLGSLSGSAAAAVFVTLISAYLADYPELRMIIYSIVLIITMLFRPQGLLGNKELSLDIFKKDRGDSRGLAGN